MEKIIEYNGDEFQKLYDEYKGWVESGEDDIVKPKRPDEEVWNKMSSGRVIDLQGPQGNAFALMAYADDFLRQMGRRDEFNAMRTEMMSGDYNNLIRIFEENFGEYVTLVGKPDEVFYEEDEW